MSQFSRSQSASDFHEPLRAKVVGFSHVLRHHGFQVGLRETEDAVRVAAHFLCADFAAFRDGLRSLYCLSQEECGTFDPLFEGYWAPPDGASRITPPSTAPRKERREFPGGLDLTTGFGDAADVEQSTRTTSGASTLEVLRTMDFSQVTPVDQVRLERLAARLWRRMYVNLPRRLRGANWKNRLHFRRTMRRNLSQGGDPLYLVFAGRKPRRPRLVVMLDVSGSMELYSFTFLRLLYVLQRRFRRVHSFVFSTALEDVSGVLAARSLGGALAALSRKRIGWNGGTRIGDCLHALVREHGGRVFRQDSVFIILSDGLDTGEPERLADGLKAIGKLARKVIWLNPLLGIPGYEPIARGMSTALPLVDVFAPAHNLESLLDIERYLVK